MKDYEFNGVSTYAHCFSVIISAKNKKEAKRKFEEMRNNFIDPAIAEFQEMLVDEPIIQ